MQPAPIPSHGTLSKWFRTVQSWRSQRKLRAKAREFARWELERTRGKRQFVIRSALTFSLVMTVAQDYVDGGFYGGTGLPKSLFDAVTYTLFGIVIATLGWSEREKKYQRALRETNLPTITDNPPPDIPK
jgi:hypothetical protein